MDFITDIKGPLLERFSPEQVNDIVDIITLALVRYDVEPKSTALVEYKADDFELVQSKTASKTLLFELMIEISNSQRDQAVRYLQAFTELMGNDNRLKVVNLCRLSRRLAKQLEKREKK